MRGITSKEQVVMLRTSAKHHEEAGNNLLASWMKSSAKHFEDVARRTNAMLDKMALGNYETVSTSRRGQFAHDWYEYEDEYSYNFSGLN